MDESDEGLQLARKVVNGHPPVVAHLRPHSRDLMEYGIPTPHSHRMVLMLVRYPGVSWPL